MYSTFECHIDHSIPIQTVHLFFLFSLASSLLVTQVVCQLLEADQQTQKEAFNIYKYTVLFWPKNI